MVDGRENWWQSPPLSRGMQYNQVNITIDLEQEFHVAYVWIQMANGPKPSTWILERSADYGKTYEPWFYFAENSAECMRVLAVLGKERGTSFRDSEWRHWPRSTRTAPSSVARTSLVSSLSTTPRWSSAWSRIAPLGKALPLQKNYKTSPEPPT